MRRLVITAAAAVAAAGLAACGSISSGSSSGGSPVGGSTGSTASCSNASIQKDLFTKGELTVATDKPVYPPWFENNNPANGKGYESAVAYAVAKQLGFKPSQVHWAYEPFDASYAPGPKKFDFDINEVSYTPQRATAVTFSNSYYQDNQALVALKGTPIIAHHTPARPARSTSYGDQIGTTSLAFITSQIQPTSQPKVFSTLNDVKSALQTHQIAALVADTPTAQFISSSEIPHSVTLGQFSSGSGHFGLLFHLGQPAGDLREQGPLDAQVERDPGRAAEEVAPAVHQDPDHPAVAMTDSEQGGLPDAGAGGWASAPGRRSRAGSAAAGRGCCPAAAAGPRRSRRSARSS